MEGQNWRHYLIAQGFPEAWLPALNGELQTHLGTLLQELARRREQGEIIYPAEPDIFNALRATPPEATRVVILGQDPYHQAGQAHGFAFSVPKGIKPPPSLVNIYKSIASDFSNFIPPQHGCLTPWAEQGVLLLNTSLTVSAGAAGSHCRMGWQVITEALLAYVAKMQPLVFVLWGKHAQKAVERINLTEHKVLAGVHPSPLSAYRGFFNQHDFKKINEALQQRGDAAIDWNLS
ncbi:uracil-DNA glycosylase [Aliidiomarina celeris]|uniref:uracil-DNA glycosylase n=1 Tax=Aliidiomarina celeris TaxID=2249428 RepID=UPI000DEB6198|nr:uracil-DNA glycosylase [Aliidiomarina celeris]